MATKGRYNSAQHSEDDYDDYSDDFISDEEPRRSAPLKNSHRSPPARGKGRGKSKNRGGGRGQGRNSQARSDPGMDAVTRRLLSASRLKISELQNHSEDLKRQLKIVADENKLYKRMQHKQEKALVKFEDRESELPQLLQAHNNEVRALREQIRRTREKYEKTDRYLRDAEDDLEKVKAKLKKYKEMAEKKDLAERSDLDQRLNQAELTIEEKESRIKELDRHLEHLKKNHRHELGIERARSKEAQRQMEEMREINTKMEAQLKEKEKLLEMKNIYSNRLLKPSSYNGTPAESPAPWRQNLKKKSPSLTELNNPREKAKVYEEKRREGQKKKQLRLPKLQKKALEPSREPKQKWEEEDREKDSDNGPQFNFTSTRQDSEADFWRRQEEEYKKKRDEANRDKQRQEDGDRRRHEEEEKQQEQFRQQREKNRRDMEDREKAERRRREQDEHERRDREERERKDRERREADLRESERKAREREEQERKEKEEQERRAREERERLDNDPRLAEERRKKDELLRRLQQMDSGRDGSQPSDPFAPSPPKNAGRSPHRGGVDMDDPFSVPSSTSPSKRANRDPFLLGRADSSDSTPSSKKDYTFTRSIENLHHGKPSRDDVSVPYLDRQKKTKAAKEDAEIGGYQPSFVDSGKSAQQKKPLSLFDDDKKHAGTAKSSDTTNKKSKLMEDLFGSQTSKSSAKQKDESEEFFLTNKKPSVAQPQPKRSTGFPWDDNPSSKTNGSAHREGSTLFGGGAALVDDDTNTGGNSSGLLPRRPRQQSSTFSSKPAVTAVDNLDDSLEEVIL